MHIWSFLPALIVTFILLGLIFGLIYLLYKQVTTFIALKQEDNELLKEIIKKPDTRYRD